MPRARQRTPELRDHVLAVAVELLTREGAAGFTARRIAAEASTSTPALYELFGDKGGLLREVFFAGFRLLHADLDGLRESADARADLVATLTRYRDFMRENPTLAEVMFSRPFTDFDPAPEEVRASGAVRELIVARVRRAVETKQLAGEPTDVAHVLVALVQGLTFAEQAGRLGRSRASVERRFQLGLRAVLDGLAP